MKILQMLAVVFLTTFMTAKGQEAPAVSKTMFVDSALTQSLFATDGAQTTVGSVLEANRGKTVLLYVWASWCPDCLKGFPALFELQKANPDVHFLFLSLDREEQRWIDGIEKHQLKGEHYWFKSGWKNAFTNYIDLNWIPRYMVIDPDGNIANYYAVEADEPAIQQAIDSIKNK